MPAGRRSGFLTFLSGSQEGRKTSGRATRDRKYFCLRCSFPWPTLREVLAGCLKESALQKTSTGEDYKKRALRAAGFVVSGYGLSQVIRLLGNLLLTRLLVPKFFGIVALASVVNRGLMLFSDIGLEPGVIRSSRSNDVQFLNTAWTMQVIRGFILWAFSAAIAVPVAKFYREPTLLLVVPAIGINAILQGLQSTSLITLARELRQGKLVYIELLIQCANLACMAIVAYISRSIWALVVGSIVASLLKTVWSHFLDPHVRNKLVLEKTAVKELLSFGKWIMISTAMMFLATQADRLVLGKLFPLAFLGVYSIAVMFAEVPKEVVGRISGGVIYPLISKFSNLPRNELRLKIKKPRSILLLLLAAFVASFACFGDVLILNLYDPRYEEAAWMLPILALGMWPLILTATADRSLYVIGKPNYVSVGNFAKFIYMVVCVPIAYKLAGNLGAVIAVAVNDIPEYIFTNYGLVREKLSLLKQDAWVTLALMAATCLCIAVRLAFGMGIPGRAVFLSHWFH